MHRILFLVLTLFLLVGCAAPASLTETPTSESAPPVVSIVPAVTGVFATSTPTDELTAEIESVSIESGRVRIGYRMLNVPDEIINADPQYHPYRIIAMAYQPDRSPFGIYDSGSYAPGDVPNSLQGEAIFTYVPAGNVDLTFAIILENLPNVTPDMPNEQDWIALHRFEFPMTLNVPEG